MNTLVSIINVCLYQSVWNITADKHKPSFQFYLRFIFFRPAEDSLLPISASIFLILFFSCNITIKPIVMTLNWFLLDEFVLLVNTVK